MDIQDNITEEKKFIAWRGDIAEIFKNSNEQKEIK